MEQDTTMIDIELVWGVVPLMFSAIALLISIRVFFLFHRREIQKKQLDLILKLIGNFQECNFGISHFYYFEKTSYYLHLDQGNLFQIAKTRFKRKSRIMDNEKTFYCPVYLTEETIKKIQIYDFIRNPMLPYKIAKCLRRAFPSNIVYMKLETVGYNLILIDKYRSLDINHSIGLESDKRSKYMSNLGVNYGDFLKHIDDTSLEINKFLRNMGVKDLNIQWNV